MTESKAKITEEKVKIFDDLSKEVIETGKCCACGSCVAYCESQAFDVIKMDGYTPKFKAKANEDNCTECGLCYFICPQTETLLDQMNEQAKIKDEIGSFLDVMAAKTTDETIAQIGQDGGIVSTIISNLFDENKIDAAIVSLYDEKFEPIPKIVFNKEDLLKSAGTRYSISSQILPLKDLYNISPDILEENGIYDIDSMRVAFVGTPCQTRAIRKMHFLSIKPAHVIKYLFSLFCFENFDYDKLYPALKKKTKVDAKNIKKTWIKKNFFVQDKNGKEHEVPIKDLDSAVRSHCHECDEFTGRFSDISVGASGAPAGYSMVIIRTETGEKAVRKALSRGLIELYIPPKEQSAEWKTKKVNWFKKMISFKHK